MQPLHIGLILAILLILYVWFLIIRWFYRQITRRR